jgi:hypothetical protein
MVMRVMLIGLLVIGAVATLETDISAHPRPCGGFPCCFSAKEWKQACEQVKSAKGNLEVWLIGKTGDEREARIRDQARQELIQCGLEPEMIGELIYNDRANRVIEQLMKEGPMVIGIKPKDK